jgi:hypothetical protein
VLSLGRPIDNVKENQMILLRIGNHGPRVEKSSVWLGRACVWTLEELMENSIREITLNVGDYVGNNVLSLRDVEGKEICEPVPFFIEPMGLSSEEFKKIRHERIPSLLKKFGAENVHDVVYGGGYASYQIDVEEYAIDDLLNHYSKELIELTKKINECLTYASQKEVRKLRSEIKGKIKWQKTIRMRFQKGLSHATSHVCERRRRTFITPTNLLLLKFHLEVLNEGATMLSRLQQRESEKMRWRGIYKLDSSGEYDEKVLLTLAELRKVLRAHRSLLTKEKFKEALPRLRVIPRDNPTLIREAEFEAVRAKNRSYKPLITLYKDFIENFHPTFMKTVPIDTQRTGDFYRVWAMCELANALDLRSIGHTMREFKNRHESVYLYFQNIDSLRHPWSEISDESALYMGGDAKSDDLSFIGPEIYLVYEGIDVFIDTIYGDFTGGLPRDKIYEALGYMYDYEFKVGIVLYPGLRFHIKSDMRVPSNYKILIEAPFRPEAIKSKKQLQKRKDYLKYLVWSAVILHRVARKKEDMARAIKSITRTIEVKYSVKT